MCQPNEEWRVLDEVSQIISKASIYVQENESYAFAKSSHALSYRTLGQCLTLSASRSGSKIAVTSVHENVSKSFQELENECNQLANAFRSQLRLKKGDVIGLWTGNSVSCITAQFAAAKLGLIVCTINPNYKGLELEYALQKAGVKTLLCPGRDSPQESVNKFFEVFQSLDTSRIPSLKNVILLDGNNKNAKSGLEYLDMRHLVSASSHQFEVADGEGVKADDATIIMFTSGTTGKPKGAVLSHFNLVNNSILTSHRLGLDKLGSRACIPVPLFHIFGMVYGSVMMAATTLEIVLTGYKYSSHAVIDAIAKHNCSHVMIVPAMTVDILNLLENSGQQLPSLEGVVTGSAPTPLEVAQNFPKKVPSVKQFMIRFGSTETGGCMSMPLEGDPPTKTVDNVGAPLDLTEMKVVNTKTGDVVKIGEAGEVWARGHNVMKGYWDDPDKTKEAIEDGWFKTGDLGTMSNDGYIKLIGRSKEMIIRGGENVAPKEIEELLHQHPLVYEAFVCGVPDERMGEEICAWIKLKDPKNPPKTDDVKNFLKDKISNFKVPRYILFVDEFPRTPTGKAQKFKMTEMSVEKLGLKNRP